MENDKCHTDKVIRNYTIALMALYDGLNLQQIGDRENITRERVRQILQGLDIDYQTVITRRANQEQAYQEALAAARAARTTTIMPDGKQRPEYTAYANMLRRCFDPDHPNYKGYGGRGVTVCERWLCADGFQNFCKDMGPRPEGKYANGKARYSIHRVNDGNYEPDSCIWATQKQQCADRRKPTRKR